MDVFVLPTETIVRHPSFEFDAVCSSGICDLETSPGISGDELGIRILLETIDDTTSCLRVIDSRS
jgi:hypothetical protein